MSVKKEASGRRYVQVEIEVPGRRNHFRPNRAGYGRGSGEAK
jgi:hypothetical protein